MLVRPRKLRYKKRGREWGCKVLSVYNDKMIAKENKIQDSWKFNNFEDLTEKRLTLIKNSNHYERLILGHSTVCRSERQWTLRAIEKVTDTVWLRKDRVVTRIAKSSGEAGMDGHVSVERIYGEDGKQRENQNLLETQSWAEETQQENSFPVSWLSVRTEVVSTNMVFKQYSGPVWKRYRATTKAGV